jgi:hypothetical protein
MIDDGNIDEVAEKWIAALCSIEKEKLRVSRAYNKRVRPNKFQVGDLEWKVILPIGSQNRDFDKWSPSWKGPFRVARTVPGNAYMVETMNEILFSQSLNGRYLKKFHPSVWKSA